MHSHKENNENKTASEVFSALGVIDRMEVGPVILEKRRLKAPYKVIRQGKESQNTLIYSFEETVFDPLDASDRNLASMMTVQLALNYGLFCKEIVFIGTFDNTDKRFIRDMMENTSREIYVNKFLMHNPFLTGEAASLPAVKMQDYTQAKLIFKEEFQGQARSKWQFWTTDKTRHCILSSGGKDSLLSYGMINEIGKETHPIFVNESGRHWYTALNAYRYFKANIPNTARVWTNSDRMFNWMLRQMPFIRKDFNTVRADDYPVRLWTVAVFLFAVLPLMKKRGIGRLVIGDEYDTSRRITYEGIQHYDGLYDQSRYFDEAMSRYFLKKGWAITQFSVLRPLAELSIQKILTLRYPELQKLQVSCHAAHQEGGHVYPCGKCEKCRRIIGMMKSFDADPISCGYNDAQVKDALSTIMTKKVKQIGEDAGHLFWMLLQENLIEADDDTRKKIKPHPETVQLRFDQERSPINAVPTDLRKKLTNIMIAHTAGAVKRIGRKWVAFNPLEDEGINKLYAFEMDPDVKEHFSGKDGDRNAPGYLWGELTWPEAEKRFQETDIAILPVGAIEQHGPHLPLDVDAFDADYLARRVAEACSHPKPLVLPLIAYGVSYHHDDFKGTISVSNDALSAFVYDIGMSLARNGIKKLVILNGHGDNSPTLQYAAQMINRDARIFTCVETGETSDVDLDKLISTPNDVHAGEIETSTSLATRPDLVKMEHARAMIPGFSSRYLNFSSTRGIPWYSHTKKISENGIMGDPTKATAEKGEKMWEIMIAHLMTFIEDLKSLTLEEIFQKRY
ncbi:MAG: creatininase family protein [Bacteroidales bacterium]|jgi:creatinine amidohydrolase/Fe(II)-dependent formamide hydrolase-like protein/7-cyano-7-deazaguanine synthase in queuosine biosynthesis|nr:creatininase family protein [Bacteroidales bacterium]